MKANRKYIVRLLGVILCCLYIALFTACASAPKDNLLSVDSSVSGGLVSTGVGGFCNSATLTPYWCVYRFETNSYDENEVEFTFYYAIDEINFEGFFMKYLDYSMGSGSSRIAEYNIYATIENFDVVKGLFAADESFSYNRLYEDKVVGETKDGVYLHEKLKFEDHITFPYEHLFDDDFTWDEVLFYDWSFPFDEYSISGYRNSKNQYVNEFAHSDKIIIPRELFIGDKGRIDLGLTECVTYENGKTTSLTSSGICFYYQVEGNQIKISNTEF